MDTKFPVQWERFLSPENLRTNLIIASLFIMGYEMLKNCIIARMKDFFSVGFDLNGCIVDEKYYNEVRKRNRKASPLYASLDWLREINAIDNMDIDKFNDIKNYRNQLSHEMLTYVHEDSDNKIILLFREMINILNKIEKWWIINVEIAINPDFDNKEIDENSVVPGRIMILQLLLDIALGTEDESKFYYNEFIKHGKKYSNTH